MNNKRGFTLIELMAVISIITLFSSIVLVAINNARDNARIAGSKQFSSHVIGQLGDNLVSYWAFDETSGTTARDSWGTNNGTVNGATWTSDGVIRGALSFDGVDDYVKVNTASSFNFTNTMTIQAWIKSNTCTDGTTYCTVLAKYNSNNTGSYELYTRNNNTIDFFIRGGGLDVQLNSVKTISLNTWTHIVGVYNDSNNSISIYFNGQRVGSAITSVSLDNASADLYIGRRSGTGLIYNGLIDEVYIFNAALTAQQIQKLYAESAPRHGVAIK